MNQVRIIGGAWRSRRIMFPDAPGLRPTPDRVRETLFNWLQADVPFSRCLDLFAGSGALGFEAASRGAREVVLVDSHPAVASQLRASAALLGADQVAVAAVKAEAFLARPPQVFDLVFLDPPFAQGWPPRICALLECGAWLAPGAKIYLEAERGWTLSGLPDHWRLLKRQAAGEVAYYLFQRQAEAAAGS